MELPNGATELPKDYADYLKTIQKDQVFAEGVLYNYPVWPEEKVAGKQGYDNFQWCLMIGEIRTEYTFLKIIISYDFPRNGRDKTWQYCIVDGSEFDRVMEFADFAEVLAFMQSKGWR